MLIGGGGAETPLYQNAINRWFDQCNHSRPDLIPIPLPGDLIWPSQINEASRIRLFKRFSVAYGLSFDRANLEDHRYPQDMPPLPVGEDTSPVRIQAATKDEC